MTKKAYVDLTPARFACSISMSCPTVYKGDKNYVIIGKLIAPEDMSPAMRQRIGYGEVAVEISAELLEGAINAQRLKS